MGVHPLRATKMVKDLEEKTQRVSLGFSAHRA